MAYGRTLQVIAELLVQILCESSTIEGPRSAAAIAVWCANHLHSFLHEDVRQFSVDTVIESSTSDMTLWALAATEIITRSPQALFLLRFSFIFNSVYVHSIATATAVALGGREKIVPVPRYRQPDRIRIRADGSDHGHGLCLHNSDSAGKLHAAKMNRPSGEATIVLAPGNTLQLSQPLILAVLVFPSSSAMAE